MKVLFLGLCLLFASSCIETQKDCGLTGEWKTVAIDADKVIDANKDGTYNTDLLREDRCSEVIIHFLANGTAQHYYKNERTKCKEKMSKINYSINGDKITFTIGGTKQVHKFKLADCKLTIYGVRDMGLTENGNENILIRSVFGKM